MKKLEHLLNEIERNIPHFEKLNLNVSKVTVGWQLEHAMLVLDSVIYSIEVSKPEEYTRKWNKNRAIVMTIQKIPRGRAKAPSRVQPADEFNETTLFEHLAKTRKNVSKLKRLNKNQFFPHPYLGHMKLKSTIKFLGVHTKHHLKIVDEIVHQQ